ncbi:MAG: hypothetical protein QOI01_3039, partial [Mycobacterium sp.]|nr:hypothetical protein [Mycobacterium sp.]
LLDALASAMALVTHATVTIEAVPSEVFAWLIDPAKWSGTEFR